MANEPDFKALAIAVLTWRLRHGLSQATVAARGGPSDTTLSAIEATEWNSSRPDGTLAKLDTGLWWPKGTARRVLFEGFDPIEEVLKLEQPNSRQTTAEYGFVDGGEVDLTDVTMPLPDSLEDSELLVDHLNQEVLLTEATVFEQQALLQRARAALERAKKHLHRMQDIDQAREASLLSNAPVELREGATLHRFHGGQEALSEPGDTSSDAIAAHEEEVSIVGEQEESDTP